MMDWSDDIDNILDIIRKNSVTMCNAHKNRYMILKGYLRYFKIPVIILSSFVKNFVFHKISLILKTKFF